MMEAAMSDAAALAAEARQADLRCFLADYAIRPGEDFEVRGVRYRCGAFDAARVRWSVRPNGVNLARAGLTGAEGEARDAGMVDYLTAHLLRQGQVFTLRHVAYRVGRYNAAKNRYHLTAEGVEEEALGTDEDGAVEADGRGVSSDRGVEGGPPVLTVPWGAGTSAGGGGDGAPRPEVGP